jgi:hypothetical protein
MTWRGWLLTGLAGWIVLAVPLGIVVGRAIRRADTNAPCGTCGHAARAHAHYRTGSDCALCDCPQLRVTRRRAPIPLPTRRTSHDDGEQQQAG